jgi:hypothetical protein
MKLLPMNWPGNGSRLARRNDFAYRRLGARVTLAAASHGPARHPPHLRRPKDGAVLKRHPREIAILPECRFEVLLTQRQVSEVRAAHAAPRIR